MVGSGSVVHGVVHVHGVRHTGIMRRIAGGMPIVRVSFNRYARLDGNGMHGYAYRWPFDYSAEVGDIVVTDTGEEVTVIGFGTDYKGTLQTLSAATGLNRRVIGWDQWPLPPVESPREGRSVMRRFLDRLRNSR